MKEKCEHNYKLRYGRKYYEKKRFLWFKWKENKGIYSEIYVCSKCLEKKEIVICSDEEVKEKGCML